MHKNGNNANIGIRVYYVKKSRARALFPLGVKFFTNFFFAFVSYHGNENNSLLSQILCEHGDEE